MTDGDGKANGVGAMRLWTVQKRAVLDAIEENGVYFPDFGLSDFVAENEGLAELYGFVLDAFNDVNAMECRGLAFAFAFSDDEGVYCFSSYGEFRDYLRSKRPVIQSLWDAFLRRDCVVLELEYTVAFNPLFIDMNDFQFLMPPVMYVPPYDPENVQALLENICRGAIAPSVFPSHLVQAHVPFIGRESIAGVYPMFDLA